MSISTIMQDVRAELTDEQKTRWTDDQLTLMINKSIRRMNQVVVRHELTFARESVAVVFNNVGKIDNFPPTKEIVGIVGLYRKDNNRMLDQLTAHQWETIVDPEVASVWAIINNTAMYKDISDSPIDGELVYYPAISIDPVDSPWGGRLDDCIVDYAAFRCKNIDEMNLAQDKELMAELEARIIDNYKRLEQQAHYATGWNN